MAKFRWGRFVAGCLLIGAGIAGGIAYFKKYKEECESLDDEFDTFEDEFDDFEDEEEEDVPAGREYVTIPKEKPAETETAAEASDDEDETDTSEAEADAGLDSEV